MRSENRPEPAARGSCAAVIGRPTTRYELPAAIGAGRRRHRPLADRRRFAAAAAPPRMPGVTIDKVRAAGLTNRRRFLRRGDDAVQAAFLGQPRESHDLLERRHAERRPRRASAASRLVSTVTAITSGCGRPSAARAVGARRRGRPSSSAAPPAACTFTIHTPRSVAARDGAGDRVGDVVKLQIEETRDRRGRPAARTIVGPADVNS